MTSAEVAHLGYDITLPFDQDGTGISPIIMLHGVTSTRETWKKLKQPIADKTGRKVYTLDARNHGESEWKDDHTYSAMAQDVNNFMDQMDIPTAVVIGHSMGGKAAMALAFSKPEKVEKLVVEDISPKPFTQTARRFPFFYLKLLRKSLELIPPEADLDTAKQLVYDYIYANIPQEHRSVREVSREHGASTLPLEKKPEGFFWKLNLDALDKTISPEFVSLNKIIGEYSGPTLFIYGTKSIYNIINDREIIEQQFPEVSFIPIEGATHLVHYEYPEEFLKAVLDFVK